MKSEQTRRHQGLSTTTVPHKGSRLPATLIKVVHFDMHNSELEGNPRKCLESLGALCRKSHLNDSHHLLLPDRL